MYAMLARFCYKNGRHFACLPGRDDISRTEVPFVNGALNSRVPSAETLFCGGVGDGMNERIAQEPRAAFNIGGRVSSEGRDSNGIGKGGRKVEMSRVGHGPPPGKGKRGRRPEI